MECQKFVSFNTTLISVNSYNKYFANRLRYSIQIILAVSTGWLQVLSMSIVWIVKQVKKKSKKFQETTQVSSNSYFHIFLKFLAFFILIYNQVFTITLNYCKSRTYLHFRNVVQQIIYAA